ncbi:YaaC family protein [Aquibacillus rhizosphaerae]|uniref:YaaC family protein n=1 Tax=Aquibacillus rhizosphaerae TaxID=3051431 RepID=A0ABT7L4X7_9BACI|nr:YaaC family protein [Aquibacillus sp. LR5S19]MDL4840918.1 YaaC family protein [Aquibacillus sp. LR5S19]
MLEKDISDFFTYLKSVNTSQKFLEKCYHKNDIANASKMSYENSYRFLYYLEHGLHFYDTGNSSSMVVKPILYFYGMVHLLKACLLTRKPDYPENTTMLAHGVTTRKRKKQQYSFLQDEVKIQYKGLFPYFSQHLFNIKHIPFEKINMEKLLISIPELNNLFYFHRNENAQIKIGDLHSKLLHFPNNILDTYHLTENKFIEKLSKFLPNFEKTQLHDSSFTLKLSSELIPSSQGPIYFHGDHHAFYLPTNRNNFMTSHEVMHHYLLLYNLSMICRYETEWWGDLLHTLPTEDYPFIKHFLSITAKKTPFLLGVFLLNEKEG